MPAFEGTIIISVWPPDPWPVIDDYLIGNNPVEGGTVSFTALTDGRIMIAITSDDGTHTELTTHPIRFKGPALMKIGIGWSDTSATVCIAGQLAASNEQELTETEEILIKFREAEATIDYSEMSEAARAARRNAVEQQAPRDGERLLTLDENIEALNRRVANLDDHLQLISDGRLHHFDNLSSDIRVLICRGGRNFNPLLQRCAGHLEKMLPVFSEVQEKGADIQEDIPEPSFDLAFNISPVSNDALVGMDLDVWLNLPAAKFYGREYTHNEILRAIADTEGSHHDPSVEPILELIKSITATSGHNILGQWLIRTGETVSALVKQLF